jgi:hypothetical protein
LLAPESVAFVWPGAGGLDAAQAAPAFACSGREAAHLLLGVMRSATVTVQRVGHCILPLMMDCHESEHAIGGLQDDDAGAPPAGPVAVDG